MNAARLTRRWQEASGDPVRMAEALVDEIDDPEPARRHGGRMNAARLIRRWQEAAGDPARMAEALVDELDPPATGAIAPSPKQDAPIRPGPERPVRETPQPSGVVVAGSDPWRKVWIGLGVQIVIVAVMTVVLYQVLP